MIGMKELSSQQKQHHLTAIRKKTLFVYIGHPERNSSAHHKNEAEKR